jgi:manganese transport protein
LSVQLGFAIIPLIHFVSDKKLMGQFSITVPVKILAWIVAATLVYLNMKLVYDQSSDYFHESGNFIWKIIIVLVAIGALSLLVYIFLHPWIAKRKEKVSLLIHPQPRTITELEIPNFTRIAIALDFSKHAEKLIAYAIGQGNKTAEYVLIHVVESASARILGKESDDLETRKDQERLDFYKNELLQKGYRFKTRLGYQNRSKEIVRIVKEENIDMLVIGAHGHTGLKDFIYGETVNTVRHELKIPVLIVNL